ncbi:MAG: esterase-like activity of phytase family protein [Pseudomonadota bacterium]
MHDRIIRWLGAIALVAALPIATSAAQQVEFVGAYTWSPDDPAVGGLSGLEVSEDGDRFWAVGDKGLFVAGTFERKSGRIAAVSLDGARPITHSRNRDPLEPFHRDAEGLALTPDGELYISFEAFHRVWVLEEKTASTQEINNPREFMGMQRNSSLEALASGPDGALYTLPERSGKLERPFPVFRLKDGEWSIPFSLPRRGEFLPVGADFGPDGRFYLLERQFLGIFGFRTRVRAFSIQEGQLQDETTLIETNGPWHDNLEGISLWRDADGAVRITMVSDNNFQPLQRTEFVEYRLTN